VLLALAFLVVDVAFLGSNLFKFADGGWYPIVLAGVVFGIMMVWRSGVARLGAITREGRESLDDFLHQLAKFPPLRVPGTAIFMTSSTTEAPLLLLHTIEHTGVLHERVVLVTVEVEDVPQVPSAGRAEIENLEHGFHRIVLHYGFMQKPNVPVGLRFCNQFGLDIDPDQATFFLGHEEIVIREGQPLFSALRTRLFALLWRNATRATAFYNIPPKRVVAIALQVEM
jgi:KUP system potassium uptake protein